MGADVAVGLVRTRFQVQEFLEQSWMIARVSLVPTVLVAVSFRVLVSFTLNILLCEIGAADLSGVGAALGAVTQVGPVVTVLIVAGAGATVIAADFGSRTIREEIDAMEVLGIDPINRLVIPRVVASTVVALMLAGLVACYRGLSVRGGPKGVPANSVFAVRGSRNIPCVEVPGKRAPDPVICRSPQQYVPSGTNAPDELDTGPDGIVYGYRDVGRAESWQQLLSPPSGG